MTIDLTQVIVTLIITLPAIISTILHKQTFDKLANSVPSEAAQHMAESVPGSIATAVALALANSVPVPPRGPRNDS
jgi:hypothetical protein